MDLNLFWCITGIVGGAIISFLVSYFFYFKGLTKKRLTYEINTFCIVSDKVNQIKGLEVTYNSNEIDNLYSSTIIIKNIGNSIVKQQDMAPLCPISVSTSGKFLKPKNEYIVSQPANKVSDYNLSYINDSQINFNFDYIPQKAIIKFSLFHTDDIAFKGDLMDGEIVTPTENQKKQKQKRILLQIIIYVVTLFLGYLLSDFFINTGGASR